MLRVLLADRGRVVFTPTADLSACRFTARGNFSVVFEGLRDSQALASPGGSARRDTMEFGLFVAA